MDGRPFGREARIVCFLGGFRGGYFFFAGSWVVGGKIERREEGYRHVQRYLDER